MTTIDLNADMGEGYGAYEWGADPLLLKIITTANIACGFHAGDPHIMRSTVDRCLEHGVAIGAHPGLPDRLGFGRRELVVTAKEASDFVLYQVGALQSFVGVAGGVLQHVKLHGALYHMASKQAELAHAIVEALHRLDSRLMIYGLSGSELQLAAEGIGMQFVAEGFADRAYMPDGSLMPRSLPGAVLSDSRSIAQQAVSLAVQGHIQTLCLHADTPKAIEHAQEIVQQIQSAGLRMEAIRRD